jgi:hypothetical protein|uniref:Uncharacterized protein n=2 Tax=root TaxID=1 RepID=A0A8S5SIA0_9CAUD|nr:MAG TPA: hypothetical protein [Myoviridae sp. ct04y17]
MILQIKRGNRVIAESADFSYSPSLQEVRKLTCEVVSVVPIEFKAYNSKSESEYDTVVYNGNTFILYQAPSGDNLNEAGKYKYSLLFYGKEVLLQNVAFLDIVSGTGGEINKIRYTHGGLFQFWGDAKQLAARIEANIESYNASLGAGYTGIGTWTLNVDAEGELTEDMIDITDGTNLFEALKNFYDKFYLNYYFSTTANGGIITITDKTRPSVNWTFKQGDGGGAVKVSSSVDTSTPVITRIIPQGGSRNVPPEYKKDAKPADESRYCPYILLPNDSDGNIRYYIDSEYGLKNYGVRGKTISNTFSGIYPSIRGKKLGDLYPSGLPEWDTYKADGEPDPQSGKVAGEGASASTRIDKIIGSTPIKSDDSDSFFIYMTSPGFNLGYKVYEDGDSSDKINDNVQPQYKPHAMFDKYRDFESFDIYGTRAYYDHPVKVTATFSGKMLFSILPIGSDAVGKKVKINLRMVLNRVLGQASPLKEVVIGEEGATGMLEIPYDKTALVGYIEKGQNTTVTIRVEFTFDSDVPAGSCKIGFSEEMTCNIHFGNQDGSQDRFYYKYASVTDAVFSMRTGTYTGTEFKINKNGIIPLYGEVNGDTGETEEDVAMFNKGARYKISCYRTDSDNAKLPLYTDGKSPSIAEGTEFVILNIVMPESYVTMAENTLEKAALDYLSRYDHENRTVSLDISSGFVAEHPSLFIDFLEGNMLKVRDDGIGVFDLSDNGQIVDMQLQIQSLEIKYSKDNMFPSYSCTIARRKILSFYERLAQENQTASTQNTTNITLGGSGTGSGTGSGGGSSNITNADHAKSAYTLDDDTPVLNWFLSALNNDDAQGIINFLKGLKISGNLINRIVKQGDRDVTYTDEDVMSALRVMVEIENSVEKMKEIFLRKDVADSTKYLLSLLGGVLIKKYAKFGDFVTGVSGGYIDEKGDMEMGSGVFRKRLFVPEIAYNRTTYFKGRMVNSPGGGCSVLSYVDNGDGTYTITPDLTDADGLSQFVDDILTTYFVTKNSEGKLNGFEEMKFRVTAADYTAKKFTVIPRPGHSDWKPAEQMVLAQTGNFTDPERQTYILIDSVNGNNCITFFDNANTWDPEPAQMPAWFGKKKGMTVAGINADNYSAVLQNIIMTGLIFQVDEITGQTVRVPLYKGEWTAGKYAYYNQVSHNGALWLCVDDNGTTTEPSETNSAWLKQVDKGDKGDPGLSVVGGGHWESANTPYSANTMVTLANCVFISKVETSNPPIRILRIKGGNFLRKKDGGYYLAGKPADWEVNEDWDMLLDGRELKGESITFLGEFATAPANPKNGDSYRNTTDRATYIYQDGRWQLMISDGKDGKGYEYIYTRGNIIDNTPEKPDSQQKDGYVPEGWTDNYLGTDIDHQVEWGCTRFKENGVWSEFSDPAVVHRWSKDGENAIMADFDNEMVNAALTSDGKVVSSQTWNTTVSMWYGTEKLTLDSITCTPDTNLLCATDKNTGVVTISVSAGATIAATNTVKITIRATKNGQQYSRDLSFTVAGVRGGADGSDAVLYSIIVSATSVSKDKNGNYSVSSVSCYRQKSVGGVISTTTDGTLKYSIDGGAETTINNNTAISSGDFTKTLKFIFYVNDQIVDIETVPMLSDGKDGADGESITAAGHWESANTPYAKNSTVSFAGGSYLSKVQISNPPLPLLRVRGGRYLRKKDGGYILSGKRSDKAVNSDWQEMTSGVEPPASYWLDSPVSTINFTSTGTPSPSAFVVTMKQNVGGNVSDTNRFYLVARKYNGSWLAHVGAILSNQISVPATAGYTQFAIRAYQSASDANAWNNNFIAEKGVGVANDGSIGATGATGAFPRDRGVFTSGQTYVWNADYRDKVIYLIGGVYYNFLVKNYGASVTAAPTSANGDSNWEAMQKFVNIATDTLFADGANVAGFMFKNNVLKSHNDEGETLLINGVTGYFKCKNADITGVITADSGRIGPFSIASGMLSSKTLYENETNLYVGFKLSAGQIEFYNERTFANVRIGGNTFFTTIEGIKYDAGIDIQSPNSMIGMHIKTLSIPLFVEGGNIFLHPNNDSYVSLHGIVGNWRNISVKASLNNNDDNVMFINRDNIEVTLPPDVPGHTIYFKRMSGGVRLTGGRILPAPGGREVSYIDLDFASGFIKCMGNYWVMFYCG